MDPIAARHAVALCSMALLAGYPVTRHDRRSVYRDLSSAEEKERLDNLDERRRSQRKQARASRKRNRR